MNSSIQGDIINSPMNRSPMSPSTAAILQKLDVIFQEAKSQTSTVSSKTYNDLMNHLHELLKTADGQSIHKVLGALQDVDIWQSLQADSTNRTVLTTILAGRINSKPFKVSESQVDESDLFLLDASVALWLRLGATTQALHKLLDTQSSNADHISDESVQNGLNDEFSSRLNLTSLQTILALLDSELSSFPPRKVMERVAPSLASCETQRILALQILHYIYNKDDEFAIHLKHLTFGAQQHIRSHMEEICDGINEDVTRLKRRASLQQLFRDKNWIQFAPMNLTQENPTDIANQNDTRIEQSQTHDDLASDVTNQISSRNEQDHADDHSALVTTNQKDSRNKQDQADDQSHSDLGMSVKVDTVHQDENVINEQSQVEYHPPSDNARNVKEETVDKNDMEHTDSVNMVSSSRDKLRDQNPVPQSMKTSQVPLSNSDISPKSHSNHESESNSSIENSHSSPSVVPNNATSSSGSATTIAQTDSQPTATQTSVRSNDTPESVYSTEAALAVLPGLIPRRLAKVLLEGCERLNSKNSKTSETTTQQSTPSEQENEVMEKMQMALEELLSVLTPPSPPPRSEMRIAVPWLLQLGAKVLSCISNFKVPFLALQMIELLARNSSADFTEHVDLVLPAMLRRLGDSKIVFRHANIKACGVVGSIIGPARMLPHLFGLLDVKHRLTRESCAKLLTMLVLEAPLAEESFVAQKAPHLVEDVVPLLKDSNAKVAAASTDFIAALFHKLWICSSEMRRVREHLDLAKSGMIPQMPEFYPPSASFIESFMTMLQDHAGISRTSNVAKALVRRFTDVEALVPSVSEKGYLELVTPSDMQRRQAFAAIQRAHTTSTYSPALLSPGPVDLSASGNSHTFTDEQESSGTPFKIQQESSQFMTPSLNPELYNREREPNHSFQRTAPLSARSAADVNSMFSQQSGTVSTSAGPLSPQYTYRLGNISRTSKSNSNCSDTGNIPQSTFPIHIGENEHLRRDLYERELFGDDHNKFESFQSPVQSNLPIDHSSTSPPYDGPPYRTVSMSSDTSFLQQQEPGSNIYSPPRRSSTHSAFLPNTSDDRFSVQQLSPRSQASFPADYRARAGSSPLNQRSSHSFTTTARGASRLTNGGTTHQDSADNQNVPMWLQQDGSPIPLSSAASSFTSGHRSFVNHSQGVQHSTDIPLYTSKSHDVPSSASTTPSPNEANELAGQQDTIKAVAMRNRLATVKRRSQLRSRSRRVASATARTNGIVNTSGVSDQTNQDKSSAWNEPSTLAAGANGINESTLQDHNVHKARFSSAGAARFGRTMGQNDGPTGWIDAQSTVEHSSDTSQPMFETIAPSAPRLHAANPPQPYALTPSSKEISRRFRGMSEFGGRDPQVHVRAAVRADAGIAPATLEYSARTSPLSPDTSVMSDPVYLTRPECTIIDETPENEKALSTPTGPMTTIAPRRASQQFKMRMRSTTRSGLRPSGSAHTRGSSASRSRVGSGSDLLTPCNTGASSVNSSFSASNAGGNELYIPTEDLTPCKNPDAALEKAMTGLQNTNEWETQFNALNNVRRLSVHHSDKLLAPLQDLIGPVSKTIDNLRSSVAKNGLMTLCDMFSNMGRAMDHSVEQLAPILLRKTADTASFISAEAERALAAMCRYSGPARVLAALINASNHKNIVIRGKASRWLDAWTEIQAEQSVTPGDQAQRASKLALLPARFTERLIKIGAKFISTASEEARHSAKRMLLRLHESGLLTEAVARRTLDRSQAESVLQLLRRGMKDVLQPSPAYSRGPSSPRFDSTPSGTSLVSPMNALPPSSRNRARSFTRSRGRSKGPSNHTSNSIQNGTANGEAHTLTAAGHSFRVQDNQEGHNIHGPPIPSREGDRAKPFLRSRSKSRMRTTSKQDTRDNQDMIGSLSIGTNQPSQENSLGIAMPSGAGGVGPAKAVVSPVFGTTPADSAVVHLQQQLETSNWRNRIDALASLAQKLIEEPMAAGSQFLAIIDDVSRRVGDGNQKVAIAAAQVVGKLVSQPAFQPQLVSCAPVVLPTLCSGIASSHKLVSDRASQAVDAFVDNCDIRVVAPPLLSSMAHGNNKVKSALLGKLERTVPKALEIKPELIMRQLLPTVFNCLDDAAPDVRDATASLLRSVADITGVKTVYKSLEAHEAVKRGGRDLSRREKLDRVFSIH